MFLLAYLFDTYLLIFEDHASLCECLGICFMVGLRHYWVYMSRENLQHFSFIVSIGVENALLVLDCTQSFAYVTCFSQQGQDVRMENFLLRECMPVLQFCFKSNAYYLLMPCYSPVTHALFVRLSDEFYVINFNVAVASDALRKYAVGYSLFCSCYWQLDVCVN